MYKDWVQSDYRVHLSGEIENNNDCQTQWIILVVITARRYNTPSGRVRCRFVYTLTTELTGFRQRRWSAERFILFQTLMLQSALHVTSFGKIRWRIDCRLDAW